MEPCACVNEDMLLQHVVKGKREVKISKYVITLGSLVLYFFAELLLCLLHERVTSKSISNYY